jgi:hypothetical protein
VVVRVYGYDCGVELTFPACFPVLSIRAYQRAPVVAPELVDALNLAFDGIVLRLERPFCHLLSACFLCPDRLFFRLVMRYFAPCVPQHAGDLVACRSLR